MLVHAIAVFAFLYLPIAILVIYSFNASRLVSVWGGFSTRWYWALIEDRAMLEAARTQIAGTVSQTEVRALPLGPKR